MQYRSKRRGQLDSANPEADCNQIPILHFLLTFQRRITYGVRTVLRTWYAFNINQSRSHKKRKSAVNIGNKRRALAKPETRAPRFLDTARGAERASDRSDVDDFLTYASALLGELEGMAHERYLDELAASLNLCKSVARLSLMANSTGDGVPT